MTLVAVTVTPPRIIITPHLTKIMVIVVVVTAMAVTITILIIDHQIQALTVVQTTTVLVQLIVLAHLLNEVILSFQKVLLQAIQNHE